MFKLLFTSKYKLQKEIDAWKKSHLDLQKENEELTERINEIEVDRKELIQQGKKEEKKAQEAWDKVRELNKDLQAVEKNYDALYDRYDVLTKTPNNGIPKTDLVKKINSMKQFNKKNLMKLLDKIYEETKSK